MSDESAHPVDPSEDDLIFPSGPWRGYWLEPRSNSRHVMELQLRFKDGLVDGDGDDDISMFRVVGHYDRESLEVRWQKRYGIHEVGYRGFRELRGAGKGIWGTWTIPSDRTGGFRIWPKGTGDGMSEAISEEAGIPVVATAEPASPLRRGG